MKSADEKKSSAGPPLLVFGFDAGTPRLGAIRLSTAGLAICGLWKVRSMLNYVDSRTCSHHFGHRQLVLHDVQSLPKPMDYGRSEDGSLAGDRTRFGRHRPTWRKMRRQPSRCTQIDRMSDAFSGHARDRRNPVDFGKLATDIPVP